MAVRQQRSIFPGQLADRRRSLHRTAVEDITLASRYECKYVISPMIVGAIRQYIQPFVRPDPFASLREGYRYPICSLYLDTDDLQLYQQTVSGEKNRFKLRVRTYSDDPARAVFLEVKRRINNIVRKRRARLTRAQADQLLGERYLEGLSQLSGKLLADVEYFLHHQSLAAAKPVIKVKYMREAYESRGGDPVRVTIDTDLEHTVTLDRDLTHARGQWMLTPVNGVILEFKFTERFPSWIHELVQFFGLKQQSVPKYVMSLDHLMFKGGRSALSLAGFVLPPRSA